MTNDEITKLNIFQPEPIRAELALTVGGRFYSKRVSLKPITLRDEKKWIDAFGNINIIEEALTNGDYSFLMSVWVNQLVDGDKAWMKSIFGIETDDELVEKILDTGYSQGAAIAFSKSIADIRGASAPGSEDGDLKKKTDGFPLGTNWRHMYAGILIGVLKMLLILRWDSFTLFIRSLS